MDPNPSLAWEKLAVPVALLISLDEPLIPNALAGAFGDSYLYRFNPLFARVRDAALGFGYRFSCEDTALWRDYQNCPLMTLNRILTDKVIPYRDNGATARRMVEQNPKAAFPPRWIAGNLQSNHAFHESAHCVAHSVLRQFDGALRALAPDPGDRFVLEAVLEESFANTVETLGTLFVHRPVSDFVFYDLNSFMHWEAEKETSLNAALDELDAATRFSVLLVSAFEANLTLEAPADEVLERIAEATSTRDQLSAKALIDIGFGLSRGFRRNTNPQYFNLMARQKEYERLQRANWLALPEGREFAREVSAAFFATVGQA